MIRDATADNCFEVVTINGQKLKVQIDTGSTLSIRPVNKNLKNKPNLQKASRRYVTY